MQIKEEFCFGQKPSQRIKTEHFFHGQLGSWICGTEGFHMLAGQGQRGIWRAAAIGYNMKAKAGTGGDYLRAFVFTTNFRETMRSERKDKDQTAWMSLLDLQQTVWDMHCGS